VTGEKAKKPPHRAGRTLVDDASLRSVVDESSFDGDTDADADAVGATLAEPTRELVGRVSPLDRVQDDAVVESTAVGGFLAPVSGDSALVDAVTRPECSEHFAYVREFRSAGVLVELRDLLVEFRVEAPAVLLARRDVRGRGLAVGLDDLRDVVPDEFVELFDHRG
jgi:hypothetical protein